MNIDYEILKASKPLIKRLISTEKWLDVQEDFRSDRGVATKFNISEEELAIIKQYWDLQ
jgi:hypothetical protein